MSAANLEYFSKLRPCHQRRICQIHSYQPDFVSSDTEYRFTQCFHVISLHENTKIFGERTPLYLWSFNENPLILPNNPFMKVILLLLSRVVGRTKLKLEKIRSAFVIWHITKLNGMIMRIAKNAAVANESTFSESALSTRLCEVDSPIG